MIPPRLPSFTLRPSAASTADAGSSSSNTVPDSAITQVSQAQAGQPPQAGAISGSAAAAGRKHPLPPPPAPRAIRPRLDAGVSQAASPSHHQTSLQRQTQVNQQAIAAALDSFGMNWNALNGRQRQDLFKAATVLPPYPPGRTEASLREEQLHAVLFSIQLEHDMARLSSQRQLLLHSIDPAKLNAFVQGVHYGGVTINGPHQDSAGRRYFYLEQQCGHACAQHAVNAMVGGLWSHWSISRIGKPTPGGSRVSRLTWSILSTTCWR